jgi:hypothetical protein
MPLTLQDVIVTLIAAAALLTVAWRLLRVAAPAAGTPACSNCASCAPAGSAPSLNPTERPAPVLWIGRQKPGT